MDGVDDVLLDSLYESIDFQSAYIFIANGAGNKNK